MKNPGGTWQRAHPLRCACPHLRIPFHCSNQLRCTFFNLHEPIHSDPSHILHLKCSAQTCVSVSFCCSTQVCLCAFFCCWSRVYIYKKLPWGQFLG